ncbi:MAG: RNB domain-containing ribonuclease, partial [Ferruginibacter sp.]
MHKKNKAGKKSSQTDIVKGRLDISKSGMGYVIVEGSEKDILVRPNDFNRAFHGDLVRVQVNKGLSKDKRQEGKIVDIAERKQTEFIGNIQMSKSFAFFIPASEKPIPDFYIATDKLNGAKDNERVVVKMLSWDKAEKKPIGEVVSILKSEDENDMAMKEILIETGFALAFDKEVLAEVKKLQQHIAREEISKRKDYRDILTFTIDPVDAKDFDDAISIRNLDNGNYEIGIHIAD